MRYSIQQIKYEFLYALKEFDSDGKRWELAISDVPPAETLSRKGLTPEDYIYMGKPAGTPRAAQLVCDFFKDRYCMPLTSEDREDSPVCDWVIMFRSKASLPNLPDLLVSANNKSAASSCPNV